MEKEELLLREYETIMNHFLEHWRQKYILVGLNITAIGTLLTLAITRINDSALLLIILSLLSSSLGIVWVGESIWGTRSINLVRDKIAPALNQLQIDVTMFTPINYPEREKLTYCEVIKNIFLGESPGAITGIFLFFIPSFLGWLSALIINCVQKQWYFWLLFAISTVLLFILIMGGLTLYKEWTKKSEETNNKESKS